MKTYLHLMKEEKFLKSVSEFYAQFFATEGHEICYIRAEKDDSLLNDEISIKQSEFVFADKRSIIQMFCELRLFLKLVNKYDYVVVHSMLLPDWLIWCIAYSEKIIKKIIWIEWGYDLYGFNLTGDTFRDKIFKNSEIKLREHCNTVVCIFPPDCDYYKKKFPNHSANVTYAPYCGARIPDEYLHYSDYSRLHQTNQNNDTIWIQIGHSAATQIDHIATLNMLKKFKDENIKILLPLSYGDGDRADMIQEYAERLFPRKVICLREFMPPKEYFKLLSRVDIAIFDTDRQIALSNINRLVFRNTKLYLKDDSIMYNYFSANGVPVQPISSINKYDFDEFRKECEIVDKTGFRAYLDNLSNIERKKRLWSNIYERD